MYALKTREHKLEKSLHAKTEASSDCFCEFFAPAKPKVLSQTSISFI